MKKRIVFSLVVALSLLSNSFLYSETNAKAAGPVASPPNFMLTPTHEEAVNALKLLMARVRAKIQMGKMDESDFADIIKDYDSLLARFNKPDGDRVDILGDKGQVYLTLEDSIKALPVFEEMKAIAPDLVINGSTEEFLGGLKIKAEKQKVRDALIGKAPPEFNEKNLQGNNLSLSKYKGKVVLLDFWATWCPPCVASIPEIEKVYTKYHDKGFEVVGMSLDDEKEDLEKFIKQKKVPWPQHLLANRFDNELTTKYGVIYAPTTFLIGRDGKVIRQLMPWNDLEQAVSDAMKKD